MVNKSDTEASPCKVDKNVFLLLSWFTEHGPSMNYLSGNKLFQVVINTKLLWFCLVCFLHYVATYEEYEFSDKVKLTIVYTLLFITAFYQDYNNYNILRFCQTNATDLADENFLTDKDKKTLYYVRFDEATIQPARITADKLLHLPNNVFMAATVLVMFAMISYLPYVFKFIVSNDYDKYFETLNMSKYQLLAPPYNYMRRQVLFEKINQLRSMSDKDPSYVINFIDAYRILYVQFDHFYEKYFKVLELEINATSKYIIKKFYELQLSKKINKKEIEEAYRMLYLQYIYVMFTNYQVVFKYDNNKIDIEVNRVDKNSISKEELRFIHALVDYRCAEYFDLTGLEENATQKEIIDKYTSLYKEKCDQKDQLGFVVKLKDAFRVIIVLFDNKYDKYYETLKIDKYATSKDIKEAYKQLARQFHPDKRGGKVNNDENIKDINNAYAVLCKNEPFIPNNVLCVRSSDEDDINDVD